MKPSWRHIFQCRYDTICFGGETNPASCLVLDIKPEYRSVTAAQRSIFKKREQINIRPHYPENVWCSSKRVDWPLGGFLRTIEWCLIFDNKNSNLNLLLMCLIQSYPKTVEGAAFNEHGPIMLTAVHCHTPPLKTLSESGNKPFIYTIFDTGGCSVKESTFVSKGDCLEVWIHGPAGKLSKAGDYVHCWPVPLWNVPEFILLFFFFL